MTDNQQGIELQGGKRIQYFHAYAAFDAELLRAGCYQPFVMMDSTKEGAEVIVKGLEAAHGRKYCIQEVRVELFAQEVVV